MQVYKQDIAADFSSALSNDSSIAFEVLHEMLSQFSRTVEESPRSGIDAQGSFEELRLKAHLRLYRAKSKYAVLTSALTLLKPSIRPIAPQKLSFSVLSHCFPVLSSSKRLFRHLSCVPVPLSAAMLVLPRTLQCLAR